MTAGRSLSRRRCSWSRPSTARKWAARYRDRGAGRDGGSIQLGPRSRPTKTPAGGGEADRAAAVASPARTRADRRRARHAGVDGARRAGALPDQPARPTSTGSPASRSAATSTTIPGSLIHVDVTKFGNIPDGGGHRFVGRQQGERNERATAAGPGTAAATTSPAIGIAFLHTVIDDHSRVAYVEICTDEKAETAVGVLRRAVAWFADRGVNVERVLSDNGSGYRSHVWRDACAELGITHKRTRPYRPQTNGKIERFHRTLADGWAYARLYDLRHRTTRPPCPAGCTSTITTASTPPSAAPPISRLNNLPGHHTSQENDGGRGRSALQGSDRPGSSRRSRSRATPRS